MPGVGYGVPLGPTLVFTMGVDATFIGFTSQVCEHRGFYFYG